MIEFSRNGSRLIVWWGSEAAVNRVFFNFGSERMARNAMLELPPFMALGALRARLGWRGKVPVVDLLINGIRVDWGNPYGSVEGVRTVVSALNGEFATASGGRSFMAPKPLPHVLGVIQVRLPEMDGSYRVEIQAGDLRCLSSPLTVDEANDAALYLTKQLHASALSTVIGVGETDKLDVNGYSIEVEGLPCGIWPRAVAEAPTLEKAMQRARTLQGFFASRRGLTRYEREDVV